MDDQPHDALALGRVLDDERGPPVVQRFKSAARTSAPRPTSLGIRPVLRKVPTRPVLTAGASSVPLSTMDRESQIFDES